MGVEYFMCSECDITLCDAGEYETINILDFGRLTVCAECGEKLRDQLFLAQPWRSDILLQIGSKRIFCEDLIHAKEALHNNSPGEKVIFGLYKSTYQMGAEIISAWTGQEKEPKKITDITEEDLQKEAWRTKLIGWCDHEVQEYPFWYKGTKRKNPYFEVQDSTVSFLRDYAEKHGLTERPIIVSTNEKTVRIFCNPFSIPAYWFDTLEELREAQWSKNYVKSNSNIEWEATREFIEERIAKIQEEIDEKQKLIDRLRAIEMNLGK